MGAELAEAKRQADFFGPFDMHRQYAKLALLGSEKIGDREAYVLEASLPARRARRISCTSTRNRDCPYSIVSQHHTPEGVSEFREEFSDYRNAGRSEVSFCDFSVGRGSRSLPFGSGRSATTSLLTMVNLPSLLYNKHPICRAGG